ncbi:hypothetical protein ACNPQK_18710 [Acinetobacter guillouiae]|uniref:hypothetical protein n=1 Tax=Acinetobacter guillouiae TaxID=106649 RepID=UPI003AF6710A
MKYSIYLPICVLLSSCTVIPDQSYHKVNCSIVDSCTTEELNNYSKPVNNLGIVNGWSANDISNKNELEKRGNKFYETSFKLQYLEYDESGNKFEKNRQLDVINNAIENSKKPVYLVVFIHGWHNNASIDPENRSLDTTGFPYLLARRSYQNPNMNVIGVYVGWRGEKYKHAPASLLSIKDRAHIADIIGQKGQVRNDIITMVNNVQKNSKSGYSLLVGHSLGGRLLSRAFLNDMIHTKTLKDWPLGENSLLVTLNPAIGADAFDTIYKNMPGIDQNLERPLWLNLTSKDDWSTARLFPSARFIGQNVTDDPISGKKQTIGHYIPYLSHEVTVVYGFDTKPKCNFINPEEIIQNNVPWFKIPSKVKDACATRHLYVYPDFDVKGKYYTSVLRPLDESPNRPLGFLWNFRVDSSIIDYSLDEAKINKSSGVHNAFVQTTLGRMLDEMLFTPPTKD